MKPPTFPIDETARIERLHGLEILDTAPEDRFDRVTRLAATTFQVPICLVSLVDTDRQWFKSRVGLETEETPRALAFCAHAILEPEIIFEVNDASRDERFVDNPLVTGQPMIRFYAGASSRSPGPATTASRRSRAFGSSPREARINPRPRRDGSRRRRTRNRSSRSPRPR